MGLTELFWGIASVGFVGLLGAVAVLVPNNVDARADRLQHSDPGTAAAVRRAQAFTDLARSGGLFLDEALIVCTPSRRDVPTLRVLSGDEENRDGSTAQAQTVGARVEADVITVEAAAFTRPQRVSATRARRAGTPQKTPRRVPSGQ